MTSMTSGETVNRDVRRENRNLHVSGLYLLCESFQCQRRENIQFYPHQAGCYALVQFACLSDGFLKELVRGQGRRLIFGADFKAMIELGTHIP